MKPERYRQVKEVFAAAVECETGERADFLARACASDEQLRREVESLLVHDRPAEHFIEESAFEVAARMRADQESQSLKEERIGAYKVVREISRGGMGVVYLARRDDDHFHKDVAIKLVKRGMDTDAVVHRFRNERQILAGLEHPYIARLLDGGVTDNGVPYFVMEYIEGQPLDKYADEQRLPIKQRLQLFRKVCEAVQYAHQNLVVHRDLKPSNILITPTGVPKLLDFGIAKVISPDSAASEPTRTETRMMTPDYASPEQVRGEKLTTRSDIYSLGVVLYELLTGHRPYRVSETAPHELARIICEQEPTKPSLAVRTISERAGDDNNASAPTTSPESISRARDTQPDKLRHLLSGDLDNIVLMALRKETQRRYQSAEQLSTDIQKYLDGLPVLAHRDTFAYRTSKFVKRNKITVAAACLVFLSLVGGICATAWQASKAHEQARIANAKTADAEAALKKTEKINAFMQTIFSYANPAWFGRAGGRRDLSVLEAMRDVEKRVDTEFKDEPDLRADVYQQIGDSYRTQDLPQDAERNLRKALSLRLELYGEDSAKVAESMFILSGVRFEQGDFAEYERLLTKALSIQRRHPDEGNNLPYMVDDYAHFLKSFKNDYAEALGLHRETLEDFRRRYGESHLMVGATQIAIFQDYYDLGDYTQAEALARESLKQHPSSVFDALSTLVSIQIDKGDYRAAEESIRQMIAQAQRPDAQPYMMPTIHYVQFFLAYRQGDYAQAIAHAEQEFATQSNRYIAHYNRALHVARSLNKLGQAKRAEALLLEEIERLRQSERAFDLARLKSVLGESLTAQRRFAEAETVLLEAYETQKARVLPQQEDLVETRQRLAELYRAWGKADEAKKYE